MTGFPIRMAVLVDFSDGSQHEYEVRGSDAVDAPTGMVLWPGAVVTTAMWEQITREQACTRALADATLKLKALREWAEGHRENPAELGGGYGARGFLGAVESVLSILDKP